jgi:transglutaminase-like putative cysteine protease
LTGGAKPGAYSAKDLEATLKVQSDNPEIVQTARKIAGASDSPLEQVKKLVKWTSENIRFSQKESFSALSVLRSSEGECQAHAKLYAALARSLKIPTRIVTGAVYVSKGGLLSRKYGFVLHAWAESYVNDGWIAVDPTKNQTPADATHVKLAANDSAAKIGSLLAARGKVKVAIIEAVAEK